jgi:hypothetical protein
LGRPLAPRAVTTARPSAVAETLRNWGFDGMPAEDG